MNKNLIAVTVLAASAFAANAYAEAGKVNFTGTIIAQGCEVSSDTINQTVDLKQIAATEFSGSGSTAGAKEFSLKLINCPTTVSSATVRFDGTQVQGNDSILALTNQGTAGVASGVGIQISDDNNNVINLHQDSTSKTLTSTGTNTLNFVARYVATADTVGAGTADAVSSFSISYQ